MNPIARRLHRTALPWRDGGLDFDDEEDQLMPCLEAGMQLLDNLLPDM